MSARHLRWVLALAFLLFLLWLMVMADRGQSHLLFDLAHATPHGDKIGHLLLFATLTLLANAALGYRRLWPGILLGSLLVLLFALGEELSQAWFPNRTLDLLDALADLMGIASANLFGLWRRRRRSSG